MGSAWLRHRGRLHRNGTSLRLRGAALFTILSSEIASDRRQQFHASLRIVRELALGASDHAQRGSVVGLTTAAAIFVSRHRHGRRRKMYRVSGIPLLVLVALSLIYVEDALNLCRYMLFRGHQQRHRHGSECDPKDLAIKLDNFQVNVTEKAPHLVRR
jgi:hypothetical protein